MKNGVIEIYRHDSEIALTHKINSLELNGWISSLKFIEKELKHLMEIWTGNIRGNSECTELIDKIERKTTENELILKALLQYENGRKTVFECDNVQCDMAFINDHEMYRKSYLYHLEKYWKVKEEFYKRVKGKLAKLV